jgi:hypothetical protein
VAILVKWLCNRPNVSLNIGYKEKTHKVLKSVMLTTFLESVFPAKHKSELKNSILTGICIFTAANETGFIAQDGLESNIKVGLEMCTELE